MDQDLSMLSPEEITLLMDAHAYITVLIAGADGNIDAEELAWAEKIAQIRTFAGDERLKEFHEKVNVEIAGKIKQFIGELPSDPAGRNAIISEKLTGLNPILSALHPSIGSYLYKGYVSFAERIAKASGGILSFFSIGPEEKKWISLPMLTAIVYNPDAEAADEEE
ncbi:MAG: hypothetical protein IPL92_07155 [Saprospiraceae bacterium]|nr:hypothetical protein [Candidatus Opimibacter iunctus]